MRVDEQRQAFVFFANMMLPNLLIASDVQDDLLIIVSFPAKRSMKQHSIIQKALPGRLELPTLRLTASRSNQLS